MSEQYPHFALVTLKEHVEPIERGERYEDRLLEVLESRHLGTVTGGGSSFDPELNEIAYANIDLELADLETAVQVVVETLESAGAPVGSEITFERNGTDEKRSFGKAEGIVVYLDGISLPDSVYQTSTIDALADQLIARLESSDLGTFRTSWAGPTETAMSFYGRSGEAIYSAVERILHAYPLCQNARVVINVHTPSQREVRIPRLTTA